MKKSVQFCQLASRSISHTTWTIPRIRDCDRWRNIENTHLVENPSHVNGYDRYEDAIYRAGKIMQERGWDTEITDFKEQCHEHLYYQHYRLRCWK